jgi:hypothetical protein
MPSTATSILDGLSTSVAVKAPCRTVATSNITLSGLQTIGGVTVVADDRVLVVGQTTASENGIYLASSGAWSRATDADGNRDLVRGTLVLVTGLENGIGYELTTANPITIGTTSQTWERRDFDDALRGDLESTISGDDGTRLVGYRRTETGSRARTVFAHIGEQIRGTDFCTFDNSTDDSTGWTNALGAADDTRSGAEGNVLELPQGISILASTKNIPNRVRVLGRNKRGSVIKAHASFSGTYMFTVDDGTNSMFDNALEHLTLDCNDVAGVGGVLSDAWQEGGGLRDVLINKFRTYGVRFRNGDGGAANSRIFGSEIFGSTLGATAGVYVDDTVSAVSSFGLTVDNCTFSGGGGAQADLPRGIHMNGGSLTARNVHFESLQTGIYLDGAGHHVIEGCKGSNSGVGVTTVIEIAATFTGTVVIKGCFRNSATNLLVDNRVGGVGTITGYDIPFLVLPAISGIPDGSVGALWAGLWFDGTAGTPAVGKGWNVSSITDNGAGDWTINTTRALQNAADMLPFGSSNTNDAIVRCDQNGVSSVRIRNRVGGALADANEVKVIIVRAA